MWSFLKILSSIIFNDDVDFDLSTRPFKSEKFGIPIFSGSHLNPELSHIALRAKEDNDLMARKYLAKLISQAIGLLDLDEITVVPIPSRTEANRKRGFAHIDELLREVAKLNKIKIVQKLLRKTFKGSKAAVDFPARSSYWSSSSDSGTSSGRRSLRVTFLVVFAFLRKTGLVWPPKPFCLES